jgi:glycosyltransferase involved in cell wall biosynthesis
MSQPLEKFEPNRGFKGGTPLSVSIIIPTYNRKAFEPLIEHNINIQDYYNILEIIILDDGDDQPLAIKTKYPIHYVRVGRCSIGTKRNLGCQLAKGDYIAMMDTDDMYSPEYISYSIFEMETNDKSIAGSADMNVYDGKDFYKQRCMFIHMLNEATLVFKNHSLLPLIQDRQNLFAHSNSNEAVPFLTDHIGDIIETNIDRLMCCVSHDTNTISKKQWLTDQFKSSVLSQYMSHRKILSTINV